MQAGQLQQYRSAAARAVRRSLPLLVLLAVLALAGPAPAQSPHGTQPDAATHLLAPGDVLSVTLFDGDKPDDFTVQLDDAGQIVLPLVQTVHVGGLTPRAAGELVTKQYRTYYVKPYVSLLIQSYGQIEVFAFGPDFTGRIVKLPSGSRLLDLLSTTDLSATNLQLTGLSAPVDNSAIGPPAASPPPAVEPASSANPTTSPTVPLTPPVLASGAYRRLHLVRGGGAFDALQSAGGKLPPLGSVQISAGGARTVESAYSSDVLSAQPADARMPLEHGLNWRRWIADRQADPASNIWVIDPLKITREGQLSQYNLALQDKDVLYVPAAERFIDLTGVARAGRYELLSEETLGDVLQLAGAPDYNRDLANAVVQRYSSTGCLSRMILNLYPGLDDLSQIASFKLQNRDHIGIYPVEQRIFVLGEVKQGGAFQFVEDSTVLDYIAQAEGETPDAHLAWIAVIRQNRDRLNATAPAEVIRVNFKELHAGYPSCTDFSLLPGDVIYVAPKGHELSTSDILTSVGTLVSGFIAAKNLAK